MILTESHVIHSIEILRKCLTSIVLRNIRTCVNFKIKIIQEKGDEIYRFPLINLITVSKIYKPIIHANSKSWFAFYVCYCACPLWHLWQAKFCRAWLRNETVSLNLTLHHSPCLFYSSNSCYHPSFFLSIFPSFSKILNLIRLYAFVLTFFH